MSQIHSLLDHRPPTPQSSYCCYSFTHTLYVTHPDHTHLLFHPLHLTPNNGLTPSPAECRHQQGIHLQWGAWLPQLLFVTDLMLTLYVFVYNLVFGKWVQSIKITISRKVIIKEKFFSHLRNKELFCLDSYSAHFKSKNLICTF